MPAYPASDTRLALYLVEPSAVITEALGTLFEDRVRTFRCFSCAESLLQERSSLAPHRALITELQLPGMNGIDLMLALEHSNLTTPTIITAIQANIASAASAMRHGAIDFIEKPCIAAELLDGLGRIEAKLARVVTSQYKIGST